MQRGVSRAQQNRKIRQEEMREKLVAQGHEQHVSEILGKLKDFDVELDSMQIQRLSKALDGHMKMLSKYLPDMKEVANELSGPGGEPLTAEIIIRELTTGS